MLLLIVAAISAGLAWATFQMLRSPEVQVPPATPSEGKAAQAKIFEVARRAEQGRAAGSSSGEPPVVFSERELNAFVSRHLTQAADLPLADIAVRLPDKGRVEITTRIPLRQLLSEPLASVGSRLPATWLDHGVWLRVGGEAGVERRGAGNRRYLRIDVDRLSVGRQPLPSILARLILDPATLQLLRWRLPDGVSNVAIEPGRAIVTTGG